MTEQAPLPFRDIKTGETNPTATVIGIWLMIMTPDGKLFVVENQKAKFVSQKVPGQLNCPAETFKQTDGSFRGTVQRAILEEVGQLDCDFGKITPVGLNRLNMPGLRVVAAPYLIPVKDEACLVYNPQDASESANPHWIDIREVDLSKTLQIGPFQVPLFRTPMAENVFMIQHFLETEGVFQIRRSTVEPIGQAVYEYLEGNAGANLLAG